MPFLQCGNITKSFGEGRLRQDVLKGVSFHCERGETCVLMGPSGSGKTTLLSILAGMLSPSSGKLLIDGREIDFSSKRKLAYFRRDHIGFVFQQAQLLPFLTIADNLRIVGLNGGLTPKAASSRIGHLMDRLGISHLRNHRPAQVSGGERQRVAVARAVISRPPLVLADEPTAALDWLNGQRAAELLTQLARDENILLITVTHDSRLLPMFQRTFSMESGSLSEL